ncbi:MAG: alkaline phosphatase [Gemmatimonadetes bacterium]|nr:alkaline phosphatase [Gemmatimonadota bacterium]
MIVALRKLAAVLVIAASSACAPAVGTGGTVQGTAGQPVNVILFIGDGVGTAYWTAARIAADSLAIERMRVMGLTDTRSDDSYVTDSAAGATVYATGHRTYNGAIGVGPRCQAMFRADSAAVMRNPASCDPLESVFDIAIGAGIGTGLVATSAITHATPASFGAKVPFRRMQPEIATQLAATPIDVLLGGGRGFFDGTLRPDSANLLTGLCSRAACLSTAADLATYRADDRRLVGLFAQNQMERAAVRQPLLAEMTRVALERLGRNPRGFFLMVEGSQPDWRGHANEPLSEVQAEMVDFDDAIAVGLDFARRNPQTLVLVVADHETGGLSLVMQGDTLAARYTTDYHTGEMTPHFAYGAGAERFAGLRENREVGRMLVEIVRNRR